MDSLYCPETDLYRRSEPGSGSKPNLPALPLRGSPGRRPPPSRGSPLHFRPRPPVPRMNRPPGPPWTHRPPFPTPRGPRPPPLGSPRGSPRGMTRGRHPGGRRPPSSRPVSCPPSRPESSGSQTPPPMEDREVTPGKESSSPSDSDLTEVPLSLFRMTGSPRVLPGEATFPLCPGVNVDKEGHKQHHWLVKMSTSTAATQHWLVAGCNEQML